MNLASSHFNWNHLRAFLATAEEGTLSAAATMLGTTQPTLSRQVAALESELGLTLFERVGQRLILTDSGSRLLSHARSMNDAANQLSLVAKGQSEQLEGSVAISVSELDAVFRLPKMIAKLRQEEPGIEIEVVVTNETSDLKRREADIAIRNFRPTQQDLIAKKLGEESIRLYGSPQYVSQFKSEPSSDIRIIGFDRSSSIYELLNSQGFQLSKENIPLITLFQPLQLELCKEGLGLIFFPEDLGNNHPNLAPAFEQSAPIMQLPVWLVCHQELRTNPRVRRVYDFIATELSLT
ncbi:LysR family transcriptional regulator [Pleionea sp. CnH1-48]|uniref:LysR family transcriptional regulator n=1 Tax=Pleionea sp. CnH1-48 TaxID=2954494 RepID=UPI00209757CE|nr:LysR family transcriptional regulator [Pleionea sp. CnH1-48]MCO7222705.1 LysR family transcriptional regulator [Pleionea sp. CnH1-48]